MGLRLRGREDQLARVFCGLLGKRHQLGARPARGCLYRSDADRHGAARQGGTERHELSALEVAEHFRLATLETQKIGRARHVDVEKGPTHEEVGRLGGDILGKLREALRRDDPGKAALAAPAHQVRHGAERQLAGLVGNFAGGRGRKKLRFVDGDEHRIPEVAFGLEKPAEEGRRATHLRFGVERFEIEHHRDPVLAHPRRDALQVGLGPGRIDDDMAELFGKRDEVAFGIDDRLLDVSGALLEEATQEVGFPRPGIALHEQPRRQ